jgi:uncharacterized protein involved in exopolysaccharide biosynthesis
MGQQNSPQVIHLSDYWNVIKKRKRLVLVFLFITVSVTLVLSFMMEPVYQASARMAIERESSASPLTGQTMEYIDMQSQQLNFNTHFKLIKSKPVIQSLLNDLKQSKEAAAPGDSELATNVVKEALTQIKGLVRRTKDNIRQLLKIEPVVLSEQELLDTHIAEIQERIDISNVRETRLLDIGVMDTDPEMAVRLANLLGRKYIEFDLANRLSSSNHNLEWMNTEVYALKKKLEDDERNFYEYKQLNKVFSLEGKQKVINQKITELNNEYLATKSKRQELDAKLDQITKQHNSSTNVVYIRSILNNKSIDDIYANLTNLELETSKLAKVFKAKHPKIEQIDGEIVKVKARLDGELKKEIENLKAQQTVLVNREKVMENSIGEFEDDAMDTSGKELKYTILQRNMDTSQKLYDTLVTKIKESGVVSGGASSNIRIVEQASVPRSPVKPNKMKNLLLSIVLGLFGGVGLAFFLEYLDQTIRTEEDVQNYLGLAVLSVIPEADNAKKRGYY